MLATNDMATAAPFPSTYFALASATNPHPARERYKSLLYRLGITETILGSLSCVLCISTIILQYTFPDGYLVRLDSLFTFMASGLWCGVFVVGSGGLGISAHRQPSVCIYNVNMALSIIAAFLSAVQTIISGMAIALSYSYIRPLHIVLTLIGFTSMVICIIHSAYTCAGTCCLKRRSEMPLTYPPVSQNYVQLMNGQYMVMPNQQDAVLSSAMPLKVATVPGPYINNEVQPDTAYVSTIPVLTQQTYPMPSGQSGIIVSQSVICSE